MRKLELIDSYINSLPVLVLIKLNFFNAMLIVIHLLEFEEEICFQWPTNNPYHA